MTSKKGRPPIENAKTNQYRIRLSDEEVDKLNYCSEALNITKAEVIRIGVDKVYEEVKKKEK